MGDRRRMIIGENDRYRILTHKGTKYIMSQIIIRIGALEIFIGWDPKIKRKGVNHERRTDES